MAYKKHIANILRVLSGNLTTILSGVFVGLLLPKYMSLSDYGFYKTFTLYITYAGLFSLGITDGVVLLHGNQDYHELDRPTFRAYFRRFIIMMTAFAAVIICIVSIVFEADIHYILCLAALDLVAINCCNYFQNVSQMTQQFKLYSNRKAMQAGLKAAIVIIYVLLHSLGRPIDYRAFLLLAVFVDYLLLIWYLFTFQDIVIGTCSRAQDTKAAYLGMMKNGFPVLCANLTVTLIMALDRQFVSVLFSTKEYAVYAFAYNMLSLVTVAVSSISVVLFPLLKRTDEITLQSIYEPMKFAILALVYGALAAYFPLCFIIQHFLPHYIPSMEFFQIISPGLAISSTIMAVMHNYYKTFGRSNAYFIQSFIVLIISAVLNWVAYKLVGTMASISVSSIIALMIWYIVANRPFRKQFRQLGLRSISYMTVMMVVFYGITAYDHRLLGFGLYVITYILTSFAFGWNDLKTVFCKGKGQ